VAFRAAAKNEPENPYPYLELSRLAQRYGDFDEARKRYAQYRKLDANPERISDDEKDEKGRLVVLIDLGDGPYRIGDVGNTKFAAHYPESGAVIRLDGDDRAFRAYRLDGVFPHAKHEAGKGVHAAKEAGLRIARKTLEILAAEKTGVMIDVPENDYRRFDLMPGEFHLVEIPLAAGRYSGSLLLTGKNGGSLGRRPFGPVQIKAGEKTFLFLRGWTGPHPPRVAEGRGPRG
jgi:hypothetical protein